MEEKYQQLPNMNGLDLIASNSLSSKGSTGKEIFFMLLILFRSFTNKQFKYCLFTT